MTDAVGGTLALTLTILAFTNSVHIWEVYALALLLGIANLVNQPAGQSILGELVGEDLLTTAVGLSVSLLSIARIIGPIFAAVLLATSGFGACFLLNTGTFVVSLVCLAAMRSHEMYSVVHVPRAHGQIRASLRYVGGNHTLKITLVLLLMMGIFCFNFTTMLPVLCKGAFGAGPVGFASIFAFWGFGGALGSLVASRKYTPELNRLGWLGVLFGISVLILAVSPTLAVADGVSLLIGMLLFWFLAVSADLLQVSARADMRGRVMALWVIVLWGSNPIGGAVVAWAANTSGPRAPLVVCGAVAVALCGIPVLWARRRELEAA